MSLSKYIFSLLIIFSIYLCFVFPTEHNTYKGLKFICGSNAPHLINVTCKFKRVNWTAEYWPYSGSWAPGVVIDNVHIIINVYQQTTRNTWQPTTVINFHVDLCEYLNGTLINKVIDMLADDLRKTSNVLRPCPHFGNFSLTNFTFDDRNFPPIVPSGIVYIDFQYYTKRNGKMIKTYFWRPYLEVKPKGIFYW